MLFEKMKVYAFVGPSGTGKSYRAQMVASEKGINFIIDDGLLIKDNQVIGKVQVLLNNEMIYEEKEDGTFQEVSRHMLCPDEGKYGIQIPAGTWHTIRVLEPSVIFEAKDGAYR